MWNNGNDCGCLWIILIILLLCCCGGSNMNMGCGNMCCSNWNRGNCRNDCGDNCCRNDCC